MKKYSIIMIICALTLTLAFVFIALNHEEKVSSYHALEKDIEESTMIYMNEDEEFKNNVENNFKVEISELVDKKYLNEEDLKINEDKCDGYIILKKESDNFTPYAYIKCSNYTSLDY